MTDSLVRIEGFHAIKHALRFGARFDRIVTTDLELTMRLTVELAPDIRDDLLAITEELTQRELDRTGLRLPRTKILAFAERPRSVGLSDLRTLKPIVVLDDPRHTGNLGAVVRVTAGLGGAGVFTRGPSDPWEASALRGSAGLHFAIPVEQTTVSEIISAQRHVVSFDPDGDDLRTANPRPSSILVFGSERTGISGDILEKSDEILRIPMAAGVSSFNLATSVAMGLYHWSLIGPGTSVTTNSS